MTETPDYEDPIDEVAANWLTARAEGFSSAQKRDFDRWCRADPRHGAAVARLEAACALLEKMPLVRAELLPVVEFPAPLRAPRAPAPAPRRIVTPLRVAVGLAAGLALAFVGVRWLTPPNPAADQIFATSAGGYERVVLADGSVLELNADTRLRVSLAPHERRVDLAAGEAHFTVAPNPARPFTVSAGGVAVRAVGTAFNVRLATTAVEVLVTEGKVSVAEVERAVPQALASSAGRSRDERNAPNGGPTSGSPTFLTANERTVFTLPSAPSRAAPTVEKIADDALREALSWQERKLVFTETPLRDVVAQFNRRNRLQLVIGDPSIAERPVGGTFAADNVEGFVRLLEGSGAITVERGDELTVVLKAMR